MAKIKVYRKDTGAVVRVPAHLVLAVVECPMGAHPGGLYTGNVPVDGYGEDYDFWVDARAATRAGADEYDAWIKHWVLDVATPPPEIVIMSSNGTSSPCPPVWLRARPATNRRGPRTMPRSTAWR